MKIEFKKAKVKDLDLIIEFIYKMARYEKLEHEVTLTKEDLFYYVFKTKLVKVLFLHVNKKPVGFVLYYYNFSTFKGRAGIHIEDIFILEEHRRQGYGKLIINKLIEEAKNKHLGRIEWVCLKWNEKSLEFYRSLGASEMNEWAFLRLDESDF
ncbi:MAG TPA: GNAT family N-acetyltransferase [Candidatus Onthovivens sp.]|nr:GNAT family N-acetyltransferase [Candidatus Onthovivens sp.]